MDGKIHCIQNDEIVHPYNVEYLKILPNISIKVIRL